MILSKSFPMSMESTDDKSRYPIHVAVAYGCRMDVIKFFLQEKPDFANLQDSSGKTPMHYAGKSYSTMYVNNYCNFPDISEVRRNTLEVVKLLVEAAPQSVNTEDEDDMNPIEYALLSSAHISIVKAMQRASRKEWKRQKEEKREKKKQDMVKALQAKDLRVLSQPKTNSTQRQPSKMAHPNPATKTASHQEHLHSSIPSITLVCKYPFARCA